MADEIVRVVRILEYSGPRAWVEGAMERSAVKGTRHFGENKVIREGVLGNYPETLGGNIDNPELNKLLFAAFRLPKDSSPEVRTVQALAELVITGHEGRSDDEE